MAVATFFSKAYIRRSLPLMLCSRKLSITTETSELAATSKSYYDSEDAQTFYSKIWDNDTIHIGRYDLLSADETARLSKVQQIRRAEDLHEVEFTKLIRSTFPSEQNPQGLRILDLGCGYGGMLRRLWNDDLVWTAVGCDISTKMCEQARRLNAELSTVAAEEISINEASYLDINTHTGINTSELIPVKRDSMDLVISMDALLHVGPEGQRKAMLEAARALRPGGWIIFSDIMEQENVDAFEMQPIYDRIHLSKMGTVSSYQNALTAVGFTKFQFISHSSNVATHYSMVRDVLLEMANTTGSNSDNSADNKIALSADFVARMAAGLDTWKTLAPKNIEWGFILAQKTEKFDLN